MRKFIVPVDFSETSLNAARYAAAFANDVKDAEIVLYNVFDSIDAGSDGTPLQNDEDGREAVIELVLNGLRGDISKSTNAHISVAAEEDGNFVDSLARYVRHHEIDAIVMGITGATRLSQILMGSNTLRVVRRNIAPVVIVPPDAKFNPAKNVLLISDLKEVTRTIPEVPLKNVLGFLQAKLYVVNVDSAHYIEPTDAYKAEKNKLDEMVKEFNPEYSFMRLYDFGDAIDAFVKDNNIDIILTVPKNDSMLSNVFKTTHTSKLAYHSHIPIIAIHS